MIKFFSLLLLIFFVLNLFGQNNIPINKVSEKSFPTNLNEENYEDIKKFNGKIIAFDGIIERSEISRNNTPFYKLKTFNDNYLWTVLMFNNNENKVGDTVRVVGYLQPAKPNKMEKKFLDGKFMVIAFGLIDFRNSFFLFLNGAEQQKQEWIEGKIPSS